MLTKQTLRRYIRAEGLMDSAFDLYQQVELYEMISRFFDRAIYFTVLGFEEETRAQAGKLAQSVPPKRRFELALHPRGSGNAR
jgi:hypothetical protein